MVNAKIRMQITNSSYRETSPVLQYLLLVLKSCVRVCVCVHASAVVKSLLGWMPKQKQQKPMNSVANVISVSN